MNLNLNVGNGRRVYMKGKLPKITGFKNGFMTFYFDENRDIQYQVWKWDVKLGQLYLVEDKAADDNNWEQPYEKAKTSSEKIT